MTPEQRKALAEINASGPLTAALMPAPRGLKDRLISLAGRYLLRPSLAVPLPWPIRRRGFALAGRLRPLALTTREEGITLAGRRAARYAPPEPTARMIWVHGGGFVVGSPRSHRGMLSHLARALNAEVIAPGYRLAPEHPFPAAPDDVEAAIEALARDLGPAPGPLYLGGDSAGGALAMVALARALQRGAPRFSGVYLISPAADLAPDRPVPQAHDYLFPAAIFERIKTAYIRKADPKDPRLSPVHGAYAGAPPVLIQCCQGEYLQADTEALALVLAKARVEVSVEAYQRLPHVFHFMAGTSASADAALGRAASFLKALT